MDLSLHCLAPDADGRRVVIAGPDRFSLMDIASGKLQFDCPLATPSGPSPNPFKFMPDSMLFVHSDGKDLVMRDSRSGTPVRIMRGHVLPIMDIDISHDGRRIATASRDFDVKLWDADTGDEVFTLRGHRAGVVCVRYSPDGHRILAGGSDRTVRIWDASPLIPEKARGTPVAAARRSSDQ